MKQFFLFLFILTTCSSSFAQNCSSSRYQQPIFSNINIYTDVVYGQADAYDAFGSSSLSDMKMDIYLPDNDTLSKRPLVLFFYGGAFVLGNKSDADVSAWCDSLAHYGYVAASVNYRLGMDLTNARSSVRAVYRAVQDARAAVRYLKHFANTYNIDTSRIYLGGESAGAFIALHTSYLNKNTDRPQETFASSNPFDAPDDNQDLGCLDCSGNNYAHTVEISGIIDLWGALQSTSFIDVNDKKVPTVIIHGTDDGIVPFTSGKPFSNIVQNFPTVYGAAPIHDRMDSLNIYNEFYPYQGLDHVFYGLPTGVVTFPNQYWQPVWTQGHTFLYHTLQFNTASPVGELTPCANGIYTYTLPFHAGSVYCWQVTNGQILGNATSNSVQIQWNSVGAGQISVQERNDLEVVGGAGTVNIAVQNCVQSLENEQAKTGITLLNNVLNGGESFTLKNHSANPQNFQLRWLNAEGKEILTLKNQKMEGNETKSFSLPVSSQGLYYVQILQEKQQVAYKVLIL
ncbi:MAG: alpha/beta hydrolase [Bacteroidia bacterium]